MTPFKPVFPVEGKDALNVREYFAAMCLQGILAGSVAMQPGKAISPKDAAEKSVEYADALIKAL